MPLDIVNHFELQVTDLTVDQLIHHKLQTPAPRQIIIYKGQELADGARRLSKYGVHVDATLCLVINDDDAAEDEDDVANEDQQPA